MIKIEELQKVIYFVLLSVTGVRCVNIIKLDQCEMEPDADKNSNNYVLNVEICADNEYENRSAYIAIANLANRLGLVVSTVVKGFFQD